MAGVEDDPDNNSSDGNTHIETCEEPADEARAAGDEDAVDALLPGARLGFNDGVALLVHFRSILRHTRADRFWQLLATWGRALYK